MKYITLSCHYCNREFQKPLNEYNRRIREGHTRFYCTLSCCWKQLNEERDNICPVVTRRCPYCGNEFTVKATARSKVFCSRSCASAGSVTEYRSLRAREALANNGRAHMGDIGKLRTILIKREAYKYTALSEYLRIREIKHQFEFVLGRWIYDLALVEYNALIEFDGLYHKREVQRKLDKEKDRDAAKNGYKVIRVPFDNGTEIPVDLLRSALLEFGIAA
jgi:very-short-patch-repair endonuclease